MIISLGVLYYLIYVISYIIELTLLVVFGDDRVTRYTGGDDNTDDADGAWTAE